MPLTKERLRPKEKTRGIFEDDHGQEWKQRKVHRRSNVKRLNKSRLEIHDCLTVLLFLFVPLFSFTVYNKRGGRSSFFPLVR